MRFNFEYVTKCVKEEILAEITPLGRVLIQHNVLRHVDLGAIIRFTAGPGLVKTLQMKEGQITYGRMATIFCNGSRQSIFLRFLVSSIAAFYRHDQRIA